VEFALSSLRERIDSSLRSSGHQRVCFPWLMMMSSAGRITSFSVSDRIRLQ
jgi:hypothetical protein